MSKKQTTLPVTKEEKAIRAVVRKQKMPKFVKGFEVELTNDQSGDPAIYVWLLVDDDLNPSKQKISELNKVRQAVSSKLMSWMPARYPYVLLRALP